MLLCQSLSTGFLDSHSDGRECDIPGMLPGILLYIRLAPVLP